jgi:hypothetical protein
VFRRPLFLSLFSSPPPFLVFQSTSLFFSLLNPLDPQFPHSIFLSLVAFNQYLQLRSVNLLELP